MSGTVVLTSPAPVLTAAPVRGLVHEFKQAGGAKRRVSPLLESGPNASSVSDFSMRGEAPGGITDISGIIPKAEYDAYKSFYVEGTTWRVFDAGDNMRCLGGGKLNDPTISGGEVLLHADGWARLPDEDIAHELLWQTRDVAGWIAADADPHNYHNRAKGTRDNAQAYSTLAGSSTVVETDNRRLESVNTVVKRDLSGLTGGEAYEVHFFAKAENSNKKVTGTFFIYNATDNSVAAQGTRTIDWTSIDEAVWLGFTAVAGKSYQLRVHFKAVENGAASDTKLVFAYSRYAKTPDINSEKIKAQIRGQQMIFRAKRGKYAGGEATTEVFWRPATDLRRVALPLDRKRHTDKYTLDVLGMVGPDGAIDEIAKLSLAAGSTDEPAVDIPAGYDQVGVRLHRKESASEDHARSYRVAVQLPKVWGSFTQANSYPSYKVIKDVLGPYASDLSGVLPDTTNALPLDAEDSSRGAIADEMCLLTNRYWALDDDGTQRRAIYEPYGTTTWLVTEARIPVDPKPMPRWNVVAVPHRYPGGEKKYVKMRANPDPFPTESRVLRINLDDPLPSKSVAEAFGQQAANLVSELHFAVTGELDTVEDPAAPGVPVPAKRLKAGHKLEFANYHDADGNRLTCRAHVVGYSDATVTFDSGPVLSGGTGHPVLDRVLARRKLVLARGRSNAWATLGGFDIDKPKAPVLVTDPMEFHETDRRGGRRHFKGLLDWVPVTEDVDGTATAIKRYVVEFRPTDNGGTPIPKIKGGGIRRVIVDRRDLEDPEVEDIPTRAWLERAIRPHTKGWKYQGHVAAVDFENQQGHFSEWSTPARPGVFGPNNVTSHTAEVNQHQLYSEVVADDPEETDDNGEPVLDQSIAHFLWRRYRNGVQYGRTHKSRATSKTWKHRKPGTATWAVGCQPVDDYGNLGTESIASATRADPATPTGPTLTTARAGKLKNKVRASGSINLDAYTEDDLNTVHVSLSVNGAEPREQRIKIPKDATGTFFYETTFHGLEAGDQLAGATKVTAKNGHESAWSGTTLTTAGTTARVAGDDIDDDSVDSRVLKFDAITVKHRLIAPYFATDAGQVPKIVIDGQADKDKVKVYGAGGTLRGNILADNANLVVSLQNSSDFEVRGGRLICNLAPKFMQTSASATGGGGGAPPAQVRKYLNVKDETGTDLRVPAYDP